MTAMAHAPGVALRMAQVTWYRHRRAIAGILGLFGAATVVLLADGAAMRSWIDHYGLAGCLDVSGNHGITPCRGVRVFKVLGTFTGNAFFAADIAKLLRALPPAAALSAGLAWLTREFETGSFRYTWVQGISPVRWLLGTFLTLAGTAAAAAAVCGAAFGWWFRVAWWPVAVMPVKGWGWDAFELSPVSLVSWTVFAMALAMLAAALIRRTVPAMASFAVTYAGCLILAEWQLRPRLLTLAPLVTRWHWDILPETPRWDDLLLSSWVTGPDGHVLSLARLSRVLSTIPQGSQAHEDQWLAAHHYASWVAYQPHSRLAVFQLILALILLTASASSVLAAIWLLRRQSSR
jgi:hypothetical protein